MNPSEFPLDIRVDVAFRAFGADYLFSSFGARRKTEESQRRSIFVNLKISDLSCTLFHGLRAWNI